MRPVAVVAASAVSARGLGWRGLGRALLAGEAMAAPCEALGGALAVQVPALPAAQDVEPKQLKLMSRGARLSCVAARGLFQEVSSLPREGTGFYLGVGASGGAVGELEAMLEASFSAEDFDLGRFGTAGLAACNPLFAFQLMNNFTLCHAAIREGLRGPNAAFFSRGAGTVLALAEAHHAVASGECDVALAGGADSALHPVTWAELRREGEEGVVPGEGAALLALASSASAPLGFLMRCEVHPGGQGLPCALESARRALVALRPERVVLSATPSRREAVGQLASSVCPGAVLEAVSLFGETLAASAALASVAALDVLHEGAARRVAVLVAGPEGDVGLVGLAREVDA